MHHYTVRVYDVGLSSLFTKADHYADYTIESERDIELFVQGLIGRGFKVHDSWIMPGAIVWVKERPE